MAALVLFFPGCGHGDKPVVVIYTSVDQMYSEPVLRDFEAKTGITVKAVYDVEAAKTTGMVNRLIAEKGRPQADVFWNGEIIQTILLKEEGVLEPFDSPATAGIPASFIDPEGFWVAIAGRARIIIVNTDLVAPGDYPRSIYDLLDSTRPAEMIGLAYPLFGTTATHAAALYTALGAEKGKEFFGALAERKIRIVDGNSVVRDMVADGRLFFGITDTDDACAAIRDGKPVAIILPDQGEGELGALIIPNTVALIKGAPHPEEARRLIDYLVSEEVEKKLVQIGWSQLPVRKITVKQSCFEAEGVRVMEVDFAGVYQELQRVKTELADLFIR